jgi:tetratricopeptide (TPR) repeat protein
MMDLSTREGRRQQGERIKRSVREAGLSLDDLAVRIGCSRALIYQYASGASLAQTDRLQVIAAVVGKSLTWYFEDPSEAKPDAPPGDVAPPSDPEADRRRIRERIQQLRTLVSAYSTSPDWRKAADTCQQILPLLAHDDDVDQTSDVLYVQGSALINAQDYGAARAKLEEAGTLFRERGNPDRALDCLQGLGHIAVQLGRAEEAISLFQRVSESQRWAHRWQGALSLGAAHEVLGDYSRSAEYFLQALDIVSENADTAQTDIARLYIDGNWANLELDWGEFAEAQHRSEQCVILAQRLGIQDQYVEALLNRGTALLGRLELSAALSDIEQAANVAQLIRDTHRWSLALATRSLAMSACRRPGDAVATAKEALAIALRCGANRAEILAQHALAEAYFVDGNLSEARYHLDQAVAAATGARLKLPLAQLASVRARIEIAAGNLALAATVAQEALKTAEELHAKAVVRDATTILAVATLAQGDTAASLAHAQSAIATIGDQDKAVVWRPLSVRAQAQDAAGDCEAARLTFAQAVEALEEYRAHCLNATGIDAVLEDPAALDLWQKWLLFIRQTNPKDALIEAERAQWPPLQQWIEELQDGPHNGDSQT